VVRTLEQSTPKTSAGCTLKEELIKECHLQSPLAYNSINYKMATIVDPRYKDKFFPSLAMSAATIDHINLLLQEMPTVATEKAIPVSSVLKSPLYHCNPVIFK